jgi:DNA polymerase-3 subunit epsilon
MSERQIILDTETTGLEVNLDHRIIEIGCVELRNRRTTGNNFWKYINPERDIDAGAQEVHGISAQFLADKPRFAEIAQALWDYLAGAELIIHNAAFDLGFLNAEFARYGIRQRIEDVCAVLDTVQLARRLHPGQKASLDALCKRYSVDNSGRELHGALLDAQLLADVYLAMTGGQAALGLDAAEPVDTAGPAEDLAEAIDARALPPLRVIRAESAELELHRARLQGLLKKSGRCLWMDDLSPPSDSGIEKGAPASQKAAV